MIPGIVLAAGASARMGTPKPLLTLGNRTFVRRILEALRDGGLPDAVVVVRPGDARVAGEVAAAGFGRIVENPRADLGQLSSLLAGLDAVDVPGIVGALVTLVDVPMISAATVRAVVSAAALDDAPIVRAVHRGRHGHPVIFKRVTFAALRAADPAVGARAVVRAHPVLEVEVDDPGVTEDVDTPQDYARVRDGTG